MPFKYPIDRADSQSSFEKVQEKTHLQCATDTPSKLYRFRSTETSYFNAEIEQAISNSKFYFPPQTMLNDPTDCMPKVEYGVTFAEYRKRIHPIITNLFVFSLKAALERGQLSKEECKNQIRACKKISTSDMRHAYNNLLNSDLVPKRLENIGVLSLTSSIELRQP